MTVLKPSEIQDVTQIIDVREPDEYRQEHIPGSRNIPLNQIGGKAAELSGQRTVLSCRSGMRAEQARNLLAAQGCQDICLLEGGLLGWKNAGMATSGLKSGFSIMQQVQITVGIMVLTGTFFKPLWFLAPLAGLGLLTAGLTNTCMLAVLLGKMPWNRSQSNTCMISK